MLDVCVPGMAQCCTSNIQHLAFHNKEDTQKVEERYGLLERVQSDGGVFAKGSPGIRIGALDHKFSAWLSRAWLFHASYWLHTVVCDYRSISCILAGIPCEALSKEVAQHPSRYNGSHMVPVLPALFQTLDHLVLSADNPIWSSKRRFSGWKVVMCGARS